jgi:tRNA(Ile)-lysidine synthetase-like protein
MQDLEVIWPAAGRYVVAVSGGADSMVLLDVLAGAASAHGYDLIVAHFDHGLRPDSAADAAFVAAAAQSYGLPYEAAAAHLGRASEAAARRARHDWLENVRAQHDAAAILTAHHQDDLLETSLLNLTRGSGRLGLAPMQTAPSILRPLINSSRVQLRCCAAAHHVVWREDPTNADLTNPRNLLRHRLLPAATPAWRANYLGLINRLSRLNPTINASIHDVLEQHRTPGGFEFPATYLRGLAPDETAEIIVAAARALRPGIALDQPLISTAVAFIRTGRPHTHRQLRLNLVLMLTQSHIRLTTKST